MYDKTNTKHNKRSWARRESLEALCSLLIVFPRAIKANELHLLNSGEKLKDRRRVSWKGKGEIAPLPHRQRREGTPLASWHIDIPRFVTPPSLKQRPNDRGLCNQVLPGIPQETPNKLVARLTHNPPLKPTQPTLP